jgi:hypothetical protein
MMHGTYNAKLNSLLLELIQENFTDNIIVISLVTLI